MSTNYHDVVSQLESAGLVLDGSLQLGKIHRCKVDGDREKRGWYSLHEVTLAGGDQVLVGSYGVWYGDDNGARKIELRGSSAMTDEQKAALKARLAEDRKRAEGLRKEVAAQAANKAGSKWHALSTEGEHDYLTRKGIAAHGLRYAQQGTTIEYEFDGKISAVDISGALAIPLCDVSGRVCALQFIYSRTHNADRIKRIGRDKDYWPQGFDKKGKFHWIGGLPDAVLFVAEGYATAASFHAATDLPVAVAFDAGNLLHVAKALHKKYPRARIGILADDDAYARCPGADCGTRFGLAQHPEVCPACQKQHRRRNTGIESAHAAALAVGGFVITPQFTDQAARDAAWLQSGQKLTDWNDLHALEGLSVVREQAHAALEAAGIALRPTPARRAVAQTKGAGESEKTSANTVAGPVEILPVSDLHELLERFVVIYGEGDVVFDRALHKLVKLKDVQNLTLSRDVYNAWTESPDRAFAMLENVGFDPAGTDPMVTCNVYRGWPTVPREGCCEMLLESLWYLCSAEENAQEVYQWVLKWLAYPIQNPGAKMQSAVVVHGGQGTGKSQFFKAVSRIYGNYALTINQSALENPRNVWLASRLFILAEEVIARKELHHVKNALKDLITGDTVYVDPKFVNPYPERNHVNLVFLSNETMPVVLEDDDRRHLVIHTPPIPQGEDFYAQVDQEIEEGGIAALHHYLATLPLDGFTPHTKPPMTASKADLIDLSRDSTTRFWFALIGGEFENIKLPNIGRADDVFKLYRRYCSMQNIHAAPMPKLINTLAKKHLMPTARKRWMHDYTVKGPHSMCWLPKQVTDGGKTRLIHVEQPPEQDEQTFIGNYVSKFAAAVSDWEEKNRGGAL